MIIGLLVVVTICAVHASRGAVARSYPGLPAYFSFDGEIFTFDNIFKSGSVGPFSINADKEDLLKSLNEYGKSFILTMPMSREEEQKLYYTRQTTVTGEGRRVLLASNQWKIAFREQGAVTVYHVHFRAGRAVQVRLLSTLGA